MSETNSGPDQPQSRPDTAGYNWCERIREAMIPVRGQELSTGEIIGVVRKSFPTADERNVLPADHCIGRPVKPACQYCQNPNMSIFKKINEDLYLVRVGSSSPL